VKINFFAVLLCLVSLSVGCSGSGTSSSADAAPSSAQSMPPSGSPAQSDPPPPPGSPPPVSINNPGSGNTTPVSAPSNGPVLPGGRFGFAYPYFSDEGSGVSTAEGFISFFAGAKHNPDWFDYRAARGQDIRALNPRGMYFKHVNLRILDSRHRGRTGRSLDGLPDHDWIHANHPEWIVRDREGKTVPLYLPEEQILDFGNDAYLDWVVNTWMPQQLFDNVDKNAAVIYLQHDNGNFRGQDIKCAPNDKVCERYTTDAGVQGAWLNMLKRVRQAFPKVRIIISTGPNTYTDPDYQMEIFKKILSAADGYYGENLTDRHVYWKNASPGEKRVALETTIRLAAWLSENDKIFMPIEGQYDGIQLSQDDTDYAFAFFNLL